MRVSGSTSLLLIGLKHALGGLAVTKIMRWENRTDEMKWKETRRWGPARYAQLTHFSVPGERLPRWAVEMLKSEWWDWAKVGPPVNLGFVPTRESIGWATRGRPCPPPPRGRGRRPPSVYPCASLPWTTTCAECKEIRSTVLLHLIARVCVCLQSRNSVLDAWRSTLGRLGSRWEGGWNALPARRFQLKWTHA